MSGDNQSDFLDVSIHASRCWEAMHDTVVEGLVVPEVSIHASRCWEAMLTNRKHMIGVIMFQSTPPVAGRRCPLS